MTDPEELLPAVLANPDDDLPRLVYADALEEAGDVARAEFIRAQIALANRPGRIDLVAREAALWAIHGPEWLAPLRRKGEGLESRTTHGHFVKGFVEIVWMPAAWFLLRAHRLFDRTPVRELRVLRASPDEFRELFQSPYVGRLRTLDLSDRRIGDRGLDRIRRAKPLDGVRRLRLRACNLSDRGAVRFAETASVRSLEELDVSLNDLSPECVELLRDRFGRSVVKFDPPTGSVPAPPGR